MGKNKYFLEDEMYSVLYVYNLQFIQVILLLHFYRSNVDL